jgi:hypothetical protein
MESFLSVLILSSIVLLVAAHFKNVKQGDHDAR